MEAPLSATLHTKTEASCSEEPQANMHPTLHARKKSVPHASKRAAWLDFLFRVDILWTILFFALLTAVGICSVVITQTVVSAAVHESWRTLHHLHAKIISKQLDQQIGAAYSMATDLLLLQAHYPTPMRSEETLATLCSVLTGYDKDMHIATLSLVSVDLRETITCMHGLVDDALTGHLTGYVSYNHTVNTTNYIDMKTYFFERPLRVAREWPLEARNISRSIEENVKKVPIFALIKDIAAGRNSDIDLRNVWRVNPILPHLMELNLPAGMVYCGPSMPCTAAISDYVLLRINSSKLLGDANGTDQIGARVALFINETLTDADPTILSNNWGQHVITSALHTLPVNSSVTYLKVSDVDDPLMRSALQHVDFAALQSASRRRTIEFQHNGAPAMVTAWVYTTSRGLSMPLVYTSVQGNSTAPHTLMRDMSNGIMVSTVLIFTLILWQLLHRTISKPLNGVQASMLASIEHGGRQLYHPSESSLVRFTEVEALIQAHNKTMQQLRNVDAFIPEGLRLRVTDGHSHHSSDVALQRLSSSLNNSRPQKLKGTQLLLHLSTVVYLSISPTASNTADQFSSLQPQTLAEEQESRPIRGQRLIAAAEQTAQAANTANSGPFPTPAALTAFITAVHELCRTHHGTLHRLCPDTCVLHFNSAVRAHLPCGQGDTSAASPSASAMKHCSPAAQSSPQPELQRATRQEEIKRHAAQDARNAVAFALDLVSWTAAQSGSGESAQRDGASAMPDVRALLDTSMFTCGQYRPAGSEQTLQVALGRDVHRDLGRVPQRIGVRVAMTEETATLVRAEDDSSGRGKVEAGVRLLPVDVLRTGRAGLDSEVVVLYEALPGRAADDAAWQLYERCCFDGFEHMLRGDYTGALAVYRGVADIADLEPGLLPAAMRREAAVSAVTGGAVSVQVARLMRECERRVRLRITEPLCTAISSLLGVDQVLSKWAMEDVSEGGHAKRAEGAAVRVDKSMADARLRQRPRRSAQSFGELPKYPEVRHRCVVHLQERQVTLRCVLPSAPRWIRDHIGLCWHLSRSHGNDEATPVWNGMRMALGSAGFIASVSFSTFRDVHPVVAKAIRDAPQGPMSDALRSATPVCGPSPEQDAFMKVTLLKHQHLRHPNIVSLIGYSHSLEGGVVLIWDFSPGGTLRELLNRYGRLPALTTIRFGLHALSALSFLHENNIAHGNLNLDTVMVDADGRCRLVGLYTHERLPFALPQTHYISPLMATGALPTPACDVFCYGLGALEGLTRQPCWRWTTKDGEPHGTTSELLELMKNGGHAFCDELVKGRVVANAEAFDTPAFAEKYSELARNTLRSCVSHTPSERPTAVEVRNIVKILLSEGGLACEEDEV